MRPTLHSLHTPPALAAWLAIEGTLRTWLEALRRRREVRRTRDALADLDCRTLRDLGIDPSEIASYASDPSDPHRARVHRSIFGLH